MELPSQLKHMARLKSRVRQRFEIRICEGDTSVQAIIKEFTYSFVIP